MCVQVSNVLSYIQSGTIQMYLSHIVLIYQFCVVQVSNVSVTILSYIYQFCVVQVSNVSVTYCLIYISSVWYKYQMYLSHIVLIYQFCVVQVSNVSVTYCLNISVLCGTSIKCICHILS